MHFCTRHVRTNMPRSGLALGCLSILAGFAVSVTFLRTGQKSYGNRSMHAVDGPDPNPYQVRTTRVKMLGRVYRSYFRIPHCHVEFPVVCLTVEYARKKTYFSVVFFHKEKIAVSEHVEISCVMVLIVLGVTFMSFWYHSKIV